MKRGIHFLAVVAGVAAFGTPVLAQEQIGPAAEAEAMAASGNLVDAVSKLQKLFQENGDATPGDVTLTLGRLLMLQNELDLAVDAFQAASNSLEGSEKAEALGRLSIVQELRGMRSEADASAAASALADAAVPWSSLARARARARAGDGAQALELAEQAVAGGGGVAAQAALAFAQEANGDLAAAEAAYRVAQAEAPDDLGVTIGLARTLRRMNRAPEAEPLIQGALAVAPGAVLAYKESARVKIALGRAAEALGDAATAAALAPDDPEAQALQKEVTVAQALGYLRTPGQEALAIPDLQALIEREPGLVIAHVGLAKAYISMRQADEALAALGRALELEPENPEALYQLGYVRLNFKNDFPGAVEPLEKAVAVDPTNAITRTEFGQALKLVGQYPRAIEELTVAVEVPGPSQLAAWIYLGEAQLQVKDYSAAARSLGQAAELAGQDNARIEANLGWAYFGLKDAPMFKLHAGKARSLGHDEPTLLGYLKRIEAGEEIK
jgi:tetratricopeptide (TPR) repeat protein